MSNDTFEKLYKKYDSMINSFVRKYNGLLEADEIRQSCLIAILKAHKTYNCHRDMKFETWIYQNMQWEVDREVRNTKHLTKDCVSLQTVLNSSEDDNMKKNCYGVRGPKNPYRRIEPYPTRGPQGQLIHPTANNGKGPQGQEVFHFSKKDTTEETTE